MLSSPPRSVVTLPRVTAEAKGLQGQWGDLGNFRHTKVCRAALGRYGGGVLSIAITVLDPAGIHQSRPQHDRLVVESSEARESSQCLACRGLLDAARPP